MGLDNLVNDKSPEQTSSSSTSSSGSSSKSREKLPEVTFLRDDETGELEVRKYPDAIWEEQSFLTETVELIIPSKTSLKTYQDMIKRHSNENLIDLMREDPERALDLCETVKGASKQEKPFAQQTCPVCDEKVDLFKEEYARINDKVVHGQHTVTDLDDAGLIGDIERNWDFVESQYRDRY